MSKIDRHFWALGDKTFEIPFQLGQKIDVTAFIDVLEKEKAENLYQYIGSDKYISTLVIANSEIKGIYYRGSFPFPDLKFWDQPQEVISKELMKHFKMVMKIIKEIFYMWYIGIISPQ